MHDRCRVGRRLCGGDRDVGAGRGGCYGVGAGCRGGDALPHHDSDAIVRLQAAILCKKQVLPVWRVEVYMYGRVCVGEVSSLRLRYGTRLTKQKHGRVRGSLVVCVRVRDKRTGKEDGDELEMCVPLIVRQSGLKTGANGVWYAMASTRCFRALLYPT